MPIPDLTNPKGSFGYLSTAGAPSQPIHGQHVRVFRNVSRSPIKYGQIVTLYVNTTAPYGSTAGGTTGIKGSSVDDCVYVTTKVGQPGVIGIALTSASSATTVSTVGTQGILPSPGAFGAPAAQYCQVVTEGPFYGMACSSANAMTAGDYIINSNTTVSDATTYNFGGLGFSLTTASLAVSTASGSFQGDYVGWCLTTQSTVGGRAFPPGTSGAARCNVWVRPGHILVPATTL